LHSARHADWHRQRRGDHSGALYQSQYAELLVGRLTSVCLTSVCLTSVCLTSVCLTSVCLTSVCLTPRHWGYWSDDPSWSSWMCSGPGLLPGAADDSIRRPWASCECTERTCVPVRVGADL